MRAAWPHVIVALAGCGRLGFEPLGHGDPGDPGDPGASPDATLDLAITSVPETKVTRNTAYGYDANSTAVAGEAWTLVGGPPGMSIDRDTGLVQWTTPATDMVVAVSLAVASSGVVATQDFSLAVVATCVAPCGSTNGLTPDAVFGSRLGRDPRARAALASQPLTGRTLAPADPRSRDVLRYVVECALPSTAAAVFDDGEVVAGQLGLAPEWAAGPCDAGCRAWVSGCLFARLNARGDHVAIAITRGTAPDDAPGVPEATFAGDWFGSPQRAVACAAPGAQLRACRDDRARCAIDRRCDRPARGVTVYLRPAP